MAVPSVDSRPAIWAGTSGPVLYKFSSSNFAQDGFRLAVSLWVEGVLFSALNYAADPITGQIIADISPMLRRALPISAVSDLTLSGDRIYKDTNSCEYYIKYQEFWVGSAEVLTDDVANKRYAVRGGLQLGNINSLNEYVTPTFKFLTELTRYTAVKNKPFLFSAVFPSSGQSFKLTKYIDNVLDSVVDLYTLNKGVHRGKIQETGDVDLIVAKVVQNDLASYTAMATPISEYFFAGAYGNGLYVAASFGGAGDNIVTSVDGITWTVRTPPTIRAWVGAAYGNGIWVLIAFDGTAAQQVATSPDGITWTARTASVNNQWTDLCFGNGLFVAIANSGAGNRVMTSPDGITWTTRVSAADLNWNAVTYGNGVFVAVGNGAMYSFDGITWLSTFIPTGGYRGVTFGEGLFVAVSADNPKGKIATSPDGIIWTARVNPLTNVWFYRVIYSKGMFLAGAGGGTGLTDVNRTMYSFDGINWTAKTLVATSTFDRLIAGPDKFVLLSNAGTVNQFYTLFTEVTVSEEKSIDVIEPCNEVQLTWKNSLGGDECYPFQNRQNINWSFGTEKKAKRLTLFAEQLRIDQWEAIQGLNTVGDTYRTPIIEMTTALIRTMARRGQDVRILNADGTQIGVIAIPQNNPSNTERVLHNANVVIELPELFLQQ